MKTLNGFEVVDTQARADIELLKDKEPDLSNYYTKAEVENAIEVDLSNYYTKDETYNRTEIQNAIAAAGGSGGGGTSGSGVKIFYLPAKKEDYTADLVAELWQFYQEWKNDSSKKIPENTIFYFKSRASSNTWLMAGELQVLPYSTSDGLSFTAYDGTANQCEHAIWFNSDGSLNNVHNTTTYFLGNSPPTWHTTYEPSDSNLYYCEGICVIAQDNNGNYLTSTVIFGEGDQLGSNSYTYYTFSDTGDYESCSWYYNGSGVVSENVTIMRISYLYNI